MPPSALRAADDGMLHSGVEDDAASVEMVTKHLRAGYLLRACGCRPTGLYSAVVIKAMALCSLSAKCYPVPSGERVHTLLADMENDGRVLADS